MTRRAGFAALFLLAALNLAAQEGTGGILAVGAGFGWTTPDSYFRNTCGAPVQQKVGRLSFTRPGFPPIIVEPETTIAAGETQRFRDLHANFDEGQIYLLAIDPCVDASARLEYRTDPASVAPVTSFDLHAVGAGMTRNGEFRTFRRVAVDEEGEGDTVSAPVFLNPNAEVVIGAVVAEGPQEGSETVVERLHIPPGVSQYLVQTPIPNGGTLRIYVTQPGELAKAIHVFVPVGPASGTTLGVRYPELPEE